MSQPGALDVERLIERLLRGTNVEFDALLAEVDCHVSVAGTSAVAHVLAVTLDGNSRPRTKDLARALAQRVVDFAIPRDRIRLAQEEAAARNSTARLCALMHEARQLFADVPNSGEGGELLLYALAQARLRIPQLLCKMPLKTNSQLHVNGIDGIHVGWDNGRLCLYWGESKLYSSVSAATKKCVADLSKFLCGDGGSSDPRDRDLHLLRTNLVLDDQRLEDALLQYLDPDHPSFNKMECRGVCLIGFDEREYAANVRRQTEELVASLRTSVATLTNHLASTIANVDRLPTFRIDAFFVPFPSVEDFRNHLREELR